MVVMESLVILYTPLSVTLYYICQCDFQRVNKPDLEEARAVL